MKEETKTQRVVYLDILRVLATVAVIVLHTAAQNWYETDIHSYEWACFNVYDSLVRYAVPIFVMISGALFLDPRREVSTKKLFCKNVFRIITAFIFWSAVYSIYTYKQNPRYSKLDVFTMFAEGHYHMWFLFMITGLYITVPILRLITRNRNLLKYFLVLSCVVTVGISSAETLLSEIVSVYPEKHLVAINGILTNNISQMSLTFVYGYVLYFALGYFLATCDITKKMRLCSYVLSAIGFVSTILLTLLFSRKSGKPDTAFYDNFCLNVFLEAIGIFVYFKYLKIRLLRVATLMQKLSNYSFGVYLMHALVLEILSTYCHLDTLSFNSAFSVPTIALLVYLVSTFVSAAIHKLPILNKYIV